MSQGIMCQPECVALWYFWHQACDRSCLGIVIHTWHSMRTGIAGSVRDSAAQYLWRSTWSKVCLVIGVICNTERCQDEAAWRITLVANLECASSTAVTTTMLYPVTNHYNMRRKNNFRSTTVTWNQWCADQGHRHLCITSGMSQFIYSHIPTRRPTLDIVCATPRPNHLCLIELPKFLYQHSVIDRRNNSQQCSVPFTVR